VSVSSFTLSTSKGQRVTVDEATSTTYQSGVSPVAPSSITTGTEVLVLGTTNGTTITAAQVVIEPVSSGAMTFLGAQVIAFQRGATTTSKEVGQIPVDWTQGSGTITGGAAADTATKAALAALPGGIVDRVVKLSNGEYNVHYIGVNWPHHVFVNQDFTVVGAE
jgi:hypothetical protein